MIKLFSNKSDHPYHHNFVSGDHVVRWTRLVVYPIQVHGIVLSAGVGVVTIVDFGLTAPPSSSSSDETDVKDKSMSNNLNEDTPLEEMVNKEDRAMLVTCEKHRHKIAGPDRINILVLTEENDIKQWKKVDYGEKVEVEKKGGRWWWSSQSQSRDDCGEKNVGKEDNENVDTKEEDIIQSKSLTPILEKPSLDEAECIDNDVAKSNIENKTEHSSVDDIKLSKSDVSETSTSSSANKTDGVTTDASTQFKLTKSDPAPIVLARVRYLATNPEILPPHHIFFSNSECIAVWCKTGVWSTLQASIYLYSTAAGNFKSAVTAAAAVGTSTVTTTVPATGVAGWFGFTTTSTVSLVSLNPWLVPVVAGYGIIAVGAPYIFIRKCNESWKNTTTMLNDKFWGEADSDVYVEAIKSWSGL